MARDENPPTQSQMACLALLPVRWSSTGVLWYAFCNKIEVKKLALKHQDVHTEVETAGLCMMHLSTAVTRTRTGEIKCPHDLPLHNPDERRFSVLL